MSFIIIDLVLFGRLGKRIMDCLKICVVVLFIVVTVKCTEAIAKLGRLLSVWFLVQLNVNGCFGLQEGQRSQETLIETARKLN